MVMVRDFIKRMILSKEIDFSEGKVFFLGKPCSVLTIETFAKLHKDLIENYGSKGRKIIYDAFFLQGQGAVERYKKFGILKNVLLKFGLPAAAFFGYGEFEVEKLDEKGEIIINIRHSPVAEGWLKLGKASEEPVCEFLRGEIAGAVSKIYECKVKATETKCLAKGDPYCQVVVRFKKK